MRMNAAVMHEQGLALPYSASRPFRIEEVDLDGPEEGEVLVEVRAAGVCHSDLSVVAGLRKRALPVVGGHEGAGIVREVGAGVQGLRAGDHVVMTVAGGCGTCRYCVQGRPVICDNVGASRAQGLLPNGARRLSRGGEPVYHYSGISCFAEYAVTVPNSLVKIDSSIPLEVAAVFGCAVVTGAGAVFNTADVRPGDRVAVFGLGGVGLVSVMAARLAGASQIIGIDLLPGKFQLAKELGCTHTVEAGDPDLVERVREISHGGVDRTFEISGSTAALAPAFAVTRKGGEVICVGVGATGAVHQYPHTQLVSEEKVLRGSLLGSGIADRDIPRFLRFYQEGRLPVDRLLSGTIDFGQLDGALDHLHDGTVIRQMLLPHA